MPKFVCRNCGMIADNPEILPVEGHNFKYNYSITCPVCLNETRFWREQPFPADINK